MKALLTAAAVSIGILGVVGPVTAQPRPYDDGYGYRDRGYRDRDYDDRDRGYRDRDDYRGGRAAYGFDEREYLRCNPDVRRAIANGQMESGAAHWRVFGRKEGRRLSC
ncbi:hypothetical protein SAMN05216360_108165 [Methylobacterium phyllostachyos]|jgi:hypothetical protein|uniref:Lectin-like protein BA14k n=1 Tax=Methylobacterium phyllostachyos TaxID=582672 RepID=A0A1H0BGC6_9HYPH|nr:hypothetical protein [Methylobacterium phyllostachyos]SDN44671.1 hypothetical protein SAMN05216360_108165 [Methylobacterium phyllostachyos]